MEPRRSAAIPAAIPAGIRAALEQRSGVDLSDVRVHYNSPRPGRFGALACTQGSEIHVGPSQQKHVAHEAWHVVQQRQGRVRATRTESGLPLNDEPGLEREADAPAGRASVSAPPAPPALPALPALPAPPAPASPGRPGAGAPIQLKAGDVDRQLTRYRTKKKPIDDADWQELLVIFAEWEKLQKAGGKRKRQGVKTITKRLIEDLGNNERISAPVRRALVERWNKDASKKNRVAVKATPISVPVPLRSSGSSLWEPLSPVAATYNFDPMNLWQDAPEPESSLEQGVPAEKERKKKRKDGPEPEADKPKKSKTLVTSSGKKKAEQETVYEVDTARQAVVAIRSFTKQGRSIPEGFRIIWGDGMFEKGPFQDIIFTLLTESTPGFVGRQGKVAKWDLILKDVPDVYWQDPAKFFRALQAGLSGPPPKDPALALMAGAMICDVKHGIDQWIQLLSELYPMLTKLEEGGDVPKLFMRWYEYAAQGGRDLRGRRHRPSYRDQPGRVKTFEWDEPTLIPSLGGFQFPGAQPSGTHPLAGQIWELLVRYGEDPAKFFHFARTSKYVYNLVAHQYRQKRLLEPKKQQ